MKKSKLLLTSLVSLILIGGSLASCAPIVKYDSSSSDNVNQTSSSKSSQTKDSSSSKESEVSQDSSKSSSNDSSKSSSSNSSSSSSSKVKKKYTVKFNTNNHGEVKDVEVIEGNKLSQPSYDVSAYKSEVFNGWYFEEGLINKVSFPLEVTSNITLYASFTTPISQGIEFSKTLGYQEGIALEFNKASGLNNYSVYYKEAGQDDSKYIKIDGMLIRDYSTYIRADIIGLKQGSYDVKVVGSNGTNDLENIFGEVKSINVISHLREGYAFTSSICPGAYNFDGTLKENAIVLYVTNDNIDTISLNNGKATYTGLSSILSGACLKLLTKPLDIRIIGNITNATIVSDGLVIDGNKMTYSKGITLEGVGNDAAIKAGVMFKGTKYGEVRNLASYENGSAKDDAFGFEQTNDYMWAHNLDIFYGKNLGGDKDKAKGDGSLDCKSTDHVTVSYNHFYDSGKANLLGMGNDSGHFASYHHNYYDNADSRQPRVRDYTVHVYNNYFKNISKYCIGNAKQANIFSENNYFDNVKYPYITGSQGHDIKDDGSSTLSKEKGGVTKVYGDVYNGANTKTSYQDNSSNFDYYLASSRDEVVPSTVLAKSGEAYSNFDTASDFYTYNVQSAEDAKNSVLAYCGRVEKGDIQYEFTTYDFNDDRSHTREAGLDDILNNYTSKMVKAGLGDNNSCVINATGSSGSQDSGSGDSGDTSKDQTPITGSITHNFATDGLTSSVFTISGTLKNKLNFTYAGVSYTQALKMETSTSITFTLEKEMNITILADGADNKAIKIDGNKYAVSSNLITTKLAAGAHTITKGDSFNIYLISLSEVE